MGTQPHLAVMRRLLARDAGYRLCPCARLQPSDSPPWGTIYRWFALEFSRDGLLAGNHSLVMADRERVVGDREASAERRDYRQPERQAAWASAIRVFQGLVQGLQDRRVRTMPLGTQIKEVCLGASATRLVDTTWRRPRRSRRSSASIQIHRDGRACRPAGWCRPSSRRSFPFIEKVALADSGYAWFEKVATATVIACRDPVRKSPDQVGRRRLNAALAGSGGAASSPGINRNRVDCRTRTSAAPPSPPWPRHPSSTRSPFTS